MASMPQDLSMKIAVCIKQVPTREWQPRLNEARTWIREQDASFEMNEPDAYALEEALQLREKHGGEVVVLCAGPDRAQSTIREALAKGADRAIHVVDESLSSKDALAVATILADAARAESPDLILTGLQSDDLGAGQTGVVVAELLGIPHSTIIMAVEVDAGRVRVKREHLEDPRRSALRDPARCAARRAPDGRGVAHRAGRRAAWAAAAARRCRW